MPATSAPSLPEALRAAARSIPASVRRQALELERGGGTAWLVGPALHDLLRGRKPVSWELHATLPVAEILSRFPTAVATASGLRRLSLPGPAGPVDLVPIADGRALDTHLAQRTFTLSAFAYRPGCDAWHDPFRGAEHALAGRLATVGPADARLRDEPLASLRCARLAATLGLELDAELEKSLTETPRTIESCKAFAVREEVTALLRAERPGAAIGILRASGLEAAIAPGARADSAAVIDRLPRSLPVRLTAWLRDTRADSILARLRFGQAPSVAILRRLRHHPLDATAAGRRAERVMGRIARAELEDLLRLRRAELEVASSNGNLEAFEGFAGRLRDLHHRKTAARPNLALDGSGVMKVLACEPGPRVGRALRFLAECVRREPECNRPAELAQRLRQWSEENSA